MQPYTSQSLLPSVRLLWTIRLLCAVALCVSGYLAWTAFQAGEVYGCGGGDIFDCGHVLKSQYSKVFGLPVSVPAFALYASLLSVLMFFRPSAPAGLLHMSWTVLTLGMLSAGLAAIWFIGVQVFVLKHLCAYCLVAHSCGLALAAIVIWKRPLGTQFTSVLSSASVLAVAVLIAAQMLAEPPQTFSVETFDVVSETQLASSEFSSPDDAADVQDFSAPIDFEAPVAFEAPVDFSAPVTSDESQTSAAVDVPPLSMEVIYDAPTESVNSSEAPHAPPSSENNSDAAAKPTASAPQESGRDDVTLRNDDGPVPQHPVFPEAKGATATLRTNLSKAAFLFFPSSSGALAVRFFSDNASVTTQTANGSSTATSETALPLPVDTANKEASDAGKPTEPTNAAVPAANSAADTVIPNSVTPAAPRPVVAPRPEPRLIGVSGNRIRLDSRQWPILGKPDARYIFVEMFDYTCPHCRNTHRTIHAAMQKYGDDLAVIALPVPLDGSCNDTVTRTSPEHASSCELSRLAIAVWRVNSGSYKTFHDWMFESHRTTAAARQKASELVGRAALDQELAKPIARDYINKHVELYKRLGRGSVPKLMFPSSTMTGEVSSTQILCSTIERECVVAK